MWDILCHKSTGVSSEPLGKGLFDTSFIKPPGQKHPDRATVETEIFHHSVKTIDTSDGGQALPPYSSTAREAVPSDDMEDETWNRNDSLPGESGSGQTPISRDSWSWAGPGFPSDMSFMDVTHDPLFQFQDQEYPYRGIWKFGNL